MSIGPWLWPKPEQPQPELPLPPAEQPEAPPQPQRNADPIHPVEAQEAWKRRLRLALIEAEQQNVPVPPARMKHHLRCLRSIASVAQRLAAPQPT